MQNELVSRSKQGCLTVTEILNIDKHVTIKSELLGPVGRNGKEFFNLNYLIRSPQITSSFHVAFQPQQFWRFFLKQNILISVRDRLLQNDGGSAFNFIFYF